MIKTNEIEIGTIIYQDDGQDPFGGCYFMMMLIGRTDKNIIVKDFSQDGKIFEYSLDGHWETEHTLPSIPIDSEIREEQNKYRRESKLNRILRWKEDI